MTSGWIKRWSIKQIQYIEMQTWDIIRGDADQMYSLNVPNALMIFISLDIILLKSFSSLCGLGDISRKNTFQRRRPSQCFGESRHVFFWISYTYESSTLKPRTVSTQLNRVINLRLQSSFKAIPYGRGIINMMDRINDRDEQFQNRLKSGWQFIVHLADKRAAPIRRHT